jgi:uncharacterized protein YkwD
MIRRLLPCLGLALTAALASMLPAWASSIHSAPRAAQEMLRIVNADRQANGLSPLAFDTRTAQVALSHSVDMAANHYLSHAGRDRSSPFARLVRAGISYRLAGENIGYDSGTTQSAMLHAIEAAMLRSPEHRANLLRTSFTRVGIGVAVYGNTLYITEDFTG